MGFSASKRELPPGSPEFGSRSLAGAGRFHLEIEPALREQDPKTRGYTVSWALHIRSEHPFAEGKNDHGLGRARRGGLEQVHAQGKPSAEGNIPKRLQAIVGRSVRRASAPALSRASPGTCLGRRFDPIRRSWCHIRHRASRTAFVRSGDATLRLLPPDVMPMRRPVSAAGLLGFERQPSLGDFRLIAPRCKRRLPKKSALPIKRVRESTLSIPEEFFQHSR